MLICLNFRFAQLFVRKLERKKRSSEEVMRRRKEKERSFQEGIERVLQGNFRPLPAGRAIGNNKEEEYK
jgi:hypothetical protein